MLLRASPAFLPVALLLVWFGFPFKGSPVRLELVESSRVYAPAQAISVRLANQSDEPIYIITEVQGRVRTVNGKALPGVPVYERRRQKFFFRSERWAYSGVEAARFRPAALPSQDAVLFPVSFSAPAKYKVRLRCWRSRDIGDPGEFLKLNARQIEDRYGRKARWLSTPAFRIRSPVPPAPPR